jgi:hypothetical protein
MKNMRGSIIYFAALFMFLIAGHNYPATTSDNTLLKYYSALLGLDLNNSIDASRIIYHLSKESEFNKDLLENILNKIEQDINNANTDIANIASNVDEGRKNNIKKSLDSVDRHLAQAAVDIKTIRNDLKNKGTISPFLADIYYQIMRAENEDHQEIRRILKLKADEEPLLIVPEETGNN